MEVLTGDDIRELLDKNDKIRAVVPAGKTIFQDLVPSIVVVGAQSHGKSSVLEAASGVKLPAGTGMVTKRPLILQLRSSGENKVCFQATSDEGFESIVLDEILETIAAETARSDQEQRSLGNPTGVVNQPMTLRIERPDLPNVTLIDLPGIKYDNEQAGERIKALIGEYIVPPSAIILVVHNCTVHTDTNEGFQLARAVDPNRLRTLCVLTHVDMIADKLLMKTNVTDLLEDVVMTHIAVRNPGASDHDEMSHAEAIEQEQQFFATNRLIKRNRYQASTGMPALMSHIKDKYSQAVRDSRVPLENALIAHRCEVERELASIPSSVNASAHFFYLWVLGAGSVDVAVQSKSGVGVVQDIHKCCEQLAADLLTVPSNLLAPKNHKQLKGSLAQLVDVLQQSQGVALPNFTPYEPIAAFISAQIGLYAGAAVSTMETLVAGLLGKIVEFVMRTLSKECGAESGSLYVDALKLIKKETRYVLGAVKPALATSLNDAVAIEQSSVWTFDTPNYTRVLESFKSRDDIDTRFLGAVAAFPEALKALQDSASLQAQAKEYYVTFGAYWHVFVHSFVDSVGKIALWRLKRASAAMRDHCEEIDPLAIQNAYRGFLSVEKKRRKLSDEKQRLEEAHRIFHGTSRAPPVRLSLREDEEGRNDHVPLKELLSELDASNGGIGDA